jgi:transposase-like protein
MNTDKRHRFPSDVISYAVWLYYKFNLSHRDIKREFWEEFWGHNTLNASALSYCSTIQDRPVLKA